MTIFKSEVNKGKTMACRVGQGVMERKPRIELASVQT